MKRPKFDDIKTYDEFIMYYWYREELREICKRLGLEYNANKTDLNNIIKAWFAGVRITHLPKERAKPSETQLTLNTSLVKCGFTFGNKFREFYIKVTGDPNFKFTADMVATAKEVKKSRDMNFTLGDLLDIKTGQKEYVKFDNSACQWNKFVKDFCADEINNCYEDKLKIASKFWALLKESDLPKVYTREFIEKNRKNIKIRKKLSEMTLEELWQLFPIILTEHKSYWVDWYNEEVTQLKNILPSDTIYHHIGSTAIKGIMAKPIIDILVIVNSTDKIKQIAANLEKQGYIIMSTTDNRISLNKGYNENGFAEKVFHLHIRLKGDSDEIYFRDYLNTHSNVRKEYELLKLRLWKEYEYNRDAYTNAKTEFVEKITYLAKK